MIEVGILANARLGQALIDYGRSQGVSLMMQPVAPQGVVILTSAEQLPQAQQEFERFLQNPEHERYWAASWTDGDSSAGFDYGRSTVMANLLSHAGPLTLTVLVVCIGIWLAWNLGLAATIYQWAHFPDTLASLSDGQWWRLFTPSLIHFGAAHVVFNLLWWWQLGGTIERHCGVTTLLTLLLVAGTLPNVLQFWFAGPAFGGLSGVVYALVGYCWIIGWRNPQSPLALPRAYVGFLLIWLVLGFSGLMNMANGAHLGGLLVGMAQAAWDLRRRSN
ncbi:MAG: rhomboid family intramembrane serine protease GlpG [Ferrimonas sp.]